MNTRPGPGGGPGAALDPAAQCTGGKLRAGAARDLGPRDASLICADPWPFVPTIRSWARPGLLNEGDWAFSMRSSDARTFTDESGIGFGETPRA